MIIKSRENKLPPTKSRKNLLLAFLHLLNFNEIGCKQCYEKDQMASVFWYFQILCMNIREKLFPRVKLSLRSNLRNFFPRNLKNPKSEKLNCHKNLLPHGFRRCGNCERFCFSCNLSAFVSRFQQSRIRELHKFFGQENRKSFPLSTFSFRAGFKSLINNVSFNQPSLLRMYVEAYETLSH